LPRKFRGRFTKVDEDNKKENLIYGQKKVFNDIEGMEYLRKADGLAEDENVAAQKILTDNDFKKMKILKLREAVKKVDRHGFRSDDESDDESDSDMSSDGYGDEEGEHSGLDSEDGQPKRAKSHRANLRDFNSEEGENEMLMEEGEEMMSYGSMMEDGEQYMWEEGESYTEFSGESVSSSNKDQNEVANNDDDEAPQLVPINEKMKTSSKPDPQEFESSEDEQDEEQDSEMEKMRVIDSDAYISSDELENFDSDEFDSDED